MICSYFIVLKLFFIFGLEICQCFLVSTLVTWSILYCAPTFECVAFNRMSCFETCSWILRAQDCREMRYLLFLKNWQLCWCTHECCCLGKEEAQLLLSFRWSSLHEHVCGHSASSLNQSSVAPGSLHIVCVLIYFELLRLQHDEPSKIEHLLLLSVEIYGIYADTDLVHWGVQGALVVLVNDLCQQSFFISLLFLQLLQDECKGLLCIYVMAGSWSVSFWMISLRMFPMRLANIWQADNQSGAGAYFRTSHSFFLSLEVELRHCVAHIVPWGSPVHLPSCGMTWDRSYMYMKVPP